MILYKIQYHSIVQQISLLGAVNVWRLIPEPIVHVHKVYIKYKYYVNGPPNAIVLYNITGNAVKRVRLMVLNATFNNISVISWQSVLLVEETRGPGEKHRPVASHWQTFSHVSSNTSCHEWDLNPQR